MRKSPLLLVLCLLAAAISTKVRAQPSSKVAFVDCLKLSSTSSGGDEHQRVRDSVADTLSSAGWTLTPVKDDCGGDKDCLAQIANNTAAPYVLRATGEGDSHHGATMQLSLYSSTANTVQKSSAYCDLCNVKRMSQILGQLATDLLAAATKEDQEIQRQRSIAPLPTPAPSPPTTNTIVTPPSVPPVPQPTKVSSWLPWVMIGVGIPSLAYGAWALHKNGECSDSTSLEPVLTCKRYSSHTLGFISLSGGGAVLILAGTLWELSPLFHSTSVSASPNHLALTVRY